MQMMEWTEYKLEELLAYEQPTAYIVNSTDYNDNYKTPVLTAGKSFIIGYTNETIGIYDKLPVIIFDDFTTASQYVNFPFKVKSSAMKILTANTELVLPKFIFYKMQTIQFNHDTHKRYWIQQYSQIKVKVPPLPEQERIVAKIEELFSQLDAAVAELKSVKEKLVIYRQAVLKEAFEKHDDWEKYQLDDLMKSVKNGYGKKPTDSGEYRILKISAVRALVLDLDESRLNRFPFEEGDLIHENDLLFTRYNGSRELVGVCAVVPKLSIDYAYPDKIIRCIPKKNSVAHSKFLSYYLNHGEARKFIRSKIKTTSGQNGISGSDLKRTEIYLPNDEIQENIVSQIEEKLSVCNDIEQTVDTALQQAAALRQSILKQAFEGNL